MLFADTAEIFILQLLLGILLNMQEHDFFDVEESYCSSVI